MNLFAILFLTVATVGSTFAQAADMGTNIAHCFNTKHVNEKYDFYEMKISDKESKFYLVLADGTRSLLAGPSDVVKLQDQGQTLILSFPPISFLIRKGVATSSLVDSYGDVEEMTCDAKW